MTDIASIIVLNPPETGGLDRDTRESVRDFLAEEAALLDERRFEEWYELLAEDLHYWMPTRANRTTRDQRLELGQADDLAYFDDHKPNMLHRVRRLSTGKAWAEDPPSRTRHIITNIRVRATEHDDEVAAESFFLIYRSRGERDEGMFSGRRQDVLRRAESAYGWQIARRAIVLDHNVILANNLSTFF